MGDWVTYTVQELVELGVIERPIDGNHGSIHPKTADFVNAGIPFVMASDLKGGHVTCTTALLFRSSKRGDLQRASPRLATFYYRTKQLLGALQSSKRTTFLTLCLHPK